MAIVPASTRAAQDSEPELAVFQQGIVTSKVHYGLAMRELNRALWQITKEHQ